jgi:hypothetical protein
LPIATIGPLTLTITNAVSGSGGAGSGSIRVYLRR